VGTLGDIFGAIVFWFVIAIPILLTARRDVANAERGQI